MKACVYSSGQSLIAKKLQNEKRLLKNVLLPEIFDHILEMYKFQLTNGYYQRREMKRIEVKKARFGDI